MEFFDKFVEKGLLEKLNKLINSNFTRIDHEEVITIWDVCCSMHNGTVTELAKRRLRISLLPYERSWGVDRLCSKP